MIWIKFGLWLLLIYTVYYALVIFWDSRGNHRAQVNDGDEELSFALDAEPLQVVPEALSAADIVSAVIASGGVSLKQTFTLAREEAIEYTRGVSF